MNNTTYIEQVIDQGIIIKGFAVQGILECIILELLAEHNSRETFIGVSTALVDAIHELKTTFPNHTWNYELSMIHIKKVILIDNKVDDISDLL